MGVVDKSRGGNIGAESPGRTLETGLGQMCRAGADVRGQGCQTIGCVLFWW